MWVFWLSKATPTLLSNKQQLNQEKVINWAGYPFIRSKYNSSSCKKGFLCNSWSEPYERETNRDPYCFFFEHIFFFSSLVYIRSCYVSNIVLYILSNNIRQHIRLSFIHVCLIPYLGQVFIWILSDFERPWICLFLEYNIHY